MIEGAELNVRANRLLEEVCWYVAILEKHETWERQMEAMALARPRRASLKGACETHRIVTRFHEAVAEGKAAKHGEGQGST